MVKKIIGIGAGGSAKVILDILPMNIRNNVIAFVDDNPKLKNQIFLNRKIVGTTSDLIDGKIEFDSCIICVGAIRDTIARSRIHKTLMKAGIEPMSVISKNAIISKEAEISSGVIIMPGVIINSGSKIKENVFINTGSIIEHDCKLEESVFLGPGVTLSGCVTIKANSFIGSGTTIIGYVTVGKNVTIGAGSVVVRNIEDNLIAFGNPAHKNKILKKEL